MKKTCKHKDKKTHRQKIKYGYFNHNYIQSPMFSENTQWLHLSVLVCCLLDSKFHLE